MFIGIDVPPDSTVVNWEAIRTYGLMNISPHPSRSQKTRFRILAGFMITMTLLYVVNLLEAMINGQIWFFKTNKSGYIRPNIHTLLPLLSCSYVYLPFEFKVVFSSIVLQERDYHHYLHVPTILPTTSIKLSNAHLDHQPSISPRKFNTLICILYISFPVVFLPLHCLSQTAEEMLQKLHDPYIRSFLLWRIASSIYIFFVTAELVIFTYGSIRLVKALGKRLQVISHAKLNHTTSSEISHHTSNPDSRTKSANWFWQWLTSNDEIEPYVWNDMNTVAFSEVRYLEENYGIINRYRNIILCQLILSGSVKVSFWILAIILAFNLFGILYNTPGIEIVMIVMNAPGIILALITTCSTFMPSLSGHLKRNTVTENKPNHQDSSQSPKTFSWGIPLRFIRFSIQNGLKPCLNQLRPIASYFRSRSDEREVEYESEREAEGERPIVIDLSNLRYDESLRTIDLIKLQAYCFDEKNHHDSFGNTTDLDVIKALRAQDGQGDK
ncbi:hypothetical protein DFH28DRAFT_986005 [Melampsora americana]|nr:hypothetical protein DFH28DRAFT_986005 [Melampsora americana]